MSPLHEYTPLMQQYLTIKERYPGIILLFQVGDFYELFFDDAKIVAGFLGITLTTRGKVQGEPIPLCGIPVHTRDHYLNKLVRGGFKVALCDQLEEPMPGKIVDRGVTQVLTPGTLTDLTLLDEKSASYLCIFFPHEQSWGLLFGELLTAQLCATVLPVTSHTLLESELARFFPDEIVLPTTKDAVAMQPWFKRYGHFTSSVEHVSGDLAASRWFAQFRADAQVHIAQQSVVRSSLELFHRYVSMTQENALSQFTTLTVYQPEDFLMLDAATQRNLELIKNNHDNSRSNSLFQILDGAVTGMGSRTIKKWIMRPLVSYDAIVQRQDAVEYGVTNIVVAQQAEKLLSAIGDFERTIGRIAVRRALLDDYRVLASTLESIPKVRQLLAGCPVSLLAVIAEHMGEFSALRALLVASLNDDATVEQVIKTGFDHTLDQIRATVEHAQEKIIALELQEQQRTGIGSLKIRYNSVHGYYIEVTKTNLASIPDDYVGRQTLVGRERFTTAQLQLLEQEIMHARTNIDTVEKEIFERVKREVFAHLGALRKSAYALAHCDALFGFAKVACANGYTRPMIRKDSRDMVILAGKHPVVAQTLGNRFIANDTQLTDAQSVWIITGPNMGGKSTYLRQVALIAIMGHCGSFVPAQSAHIPVLDRIFTRIGAGDNLAHGKSTFLVEMEETALICHYATDRSLVILDEVGRGTSTFDGLAIAQAVVEYIYTTIKARCLFATHYHELVDLTERFEGIESYYAANKKTPQGILFLYKMVKGVADGSFGVEVAKLAELPPTVIHRAQEILDELHAPGQSAVVPARTIIQDATIPSDAQIDTQRDAQRVAQERLFSMLKGIDYDDLSPKRALDLLWQIKTTLE